MDCKGDDLDRTELVERLSKGYRDEEIACEFGLTPREVRSRRREQLAKKMPGTSAPDLEFME
ncbi:MAG: hypothetical protein ACOZCF_10900 [Bacillota bacterium]